MKQWHKGQIDLTCHCHRDLWPDINMLSAERNVTLHNIENKIIKSFSKEMTTNVEL